MNMEWVEIDSIKPNPKNRNKHSKEQIERLAEIIKYQGWRHPLIVSKNSGMLVVGHGRLEAAKLLKEPKVPIQIQEFQSQEQEYAFGVSDNSIASWAELDLSGINLDIPELGPDFNLELLGIKDFELEPADKYGDKDADDTPKTRTTDIKLGDHFSLGSHRLLCGDSTDARQVSRLMNSEKADMVFTDPPYNVASESKNFAKDKSKAMDDLSNAAWDKDFKIEPALDRLREVASDNSTVYVWTSHWLVEKIWAHLKTWCDYTSYCVWTKPNPMPSLSKRHWTWATELCVYGSVGSKRVVNFPSEGHALNWWSDTKHSDGTHPTQKPIEICERPILFSSNPGQLVLDLFLGSGSTLIACEKTKRKCYGMEIDPVYCQVVIDRWEKFTGQKAVKVE